MRKKIAILGAGSMGTSLTKLLTEAGHEVALYSIEPEVIQELKEKRTNNKYLPGVILSEKFYISGDLKSVLAHSHYIVFAVPAQEVSGLTAKIKPLFKRPMTVINVAKGLEKITHNRLSVAIKKILGNIKYCCLTGPSHAEEIARQMPTAVVAASEDIAVAKDVQALFTTPSFRVYTTTDIIGAELGGALKNPIAICAGIIKGIGFGDNTKVALIMRSMEEIIRLAVKLGAKEKTMRGLAGMGDLIVTCMSEHSRNYRFGLFIGQGLSVEKALKKVGMVVEGYQTCPVVCELTNLHHIDMPITKQAYEIIFNNKLPHKAIRELMTRNLKNETD